MEIVGATGLGGLWALEWANLFLGQSIGIDETNTAAATKIAPMCTQFFFMLQYGLFPIFLFCL